MFSGDEVWSRGWRLNPLLPQYWRLTPTERLPCLGELVSSTARMPVRTGTSDRNRAHTGSASHGESVMKCYSALVAGHPTLVFQALDGASGVSP